MLNEDFLTENLFGENKKKFLEFCDAWSVVNGDIVLCGVLLKFNDYKALLNMLFYRLNRMEFGRVAFSNANYPLVCLEY